MPKKADTLLKSFRGMVRKRETIRTKIENLLTNNILDENEVFIFYEGLFIGLFTDFEKFIGELFCGFVEGKITIYGYKINEIRKVKIAPQSDIEEVILGGKQYLDWLPYERTIERAKIFFYDGIPFTNLDDDQKNNLRDYHKIRNAIAHKSRKSEAEFNKTIKNSRLPPSEQTPGGYLRSKPRGQGQQTQYEIASAQLIQIALNLCRINV